MEIMTRSAAETEAAGESLGKTLGGGCVVALRGGLGAGKTAFVRGLARGLGVTQRVTSPTFAIVHEYEGKGIPLFHFDWYRLSGEAALDEIGWDEYLARGGVVAVEWSERAPGALPPDALIVTIRAEGERQETDGGPGERSIHIAYPGH